MEAHSSNANSAPHLMRLLCVFIGESGFLQGREVTKRAESSSFAKGRLEPKAASTVTFVTQE
jgi:hypothetical protein